MNETKYNLNRFNQGSRKDAVMVSVAFTERIVGIFVLAQEITESALFTERIGSDISAAIGVFTSAVFSEIISSQKINANANIVQRASFNEQINANIKVVMNFHIYVECSEQTGFYGYLSANQSKVITYTENIGADINIGLTRSIESEFYEIILAIIEAESHELQTCVLNVALEPNSKIVIDSETYTIMVDGKNAIHVHDGAWIDKLTRNTLAITIDCGTTQHLDTEILYTERYL